MIYVLVGVLAGLLLIAAGSYQAGVKDGEDRAARRLEALKGALRTVQPPPQLPQPRELPKAGYLAITPNPRTDYFPADPYPTTPNLLVSEWQAGVAHDLADTERQIKAILRIAEETLPPRYR